MPPPEKGKSPLWSLPCFSDGKKRKNESWRECCRFWQGGHCTSTGRIFSSWVSSDPAFDDAEGNNGRRHTPPREKFRIKSQLEFYPSRREPGRICTQKKNSRFRRIIWQRYKTQEKINGCTPAQNELKLVLSWSYQTSFFHASTFKTLLIKTKGTEYLFPKLRHTLFGAPPLRQPWETNGSFFFFLSFFQIRALRRRPSAVPNTSRTT